MGECTLHPHVRVHEKKSSPDLHIKHEGATGRQRVEFRGKKRASGKTECHRLKGLKRLAEQNDDEKGEKESEDEGRRGGSNGAKMEGLAGVGGWG